MITVINVKHVAPGSFEYCGRANPMYKLKQSPLANPFKLDKDTPAERERVITQYREWLEAKIAANDSAVVNELARLKVLAAKGDVALGCWCADKRCHCDVIKDVLMRKDDTDNVTPRHRALITARIAAYGSATARTPADYTSKEVLMVYGREMAAKDDKKK